MRWRNSTTHWGLTSRLFHWLMAICILFTAGLGITMINVRLSPMKLEMFILHKTIGIGLLMAVVARIFWRMINVTPELPDSISKTEIRLARIGQVWIYLLLIAIPVSGWVINSAANFPLNWLGLFRVPAIVEPNLVIEETAKRTHLFLLILLGLTLSGHIFAALRHHFIHGNNVLRRMLG